MNAPSAAPAPLAPHDTKSRLLTALMSLSFALAVGIAATLLLIRFVAGELPDAGTIEGNDDTPPSMSLIEGDGEGPLGLATMLELLGDQQAVATHYIVPRMWPAFLAAMILLPIAGCAGNARLLEVLGSLVSAVAFWVAFNASLLLTYSKVWQFTKSDLLAEQHPDLVALGFDGLALKSIIGIDTMLGQMPLAVVVAAAIGLLFVGLSRSAGSYARRGAAMAAAAQAKD